MAYIKILQGVRERLAEFVYRYMIEDVHPMGRDDVEEKVDVLAKRLGDEQRARDAPFVVRWLRWWQSRKGDEKSTDGDREI